MQKEDKAEVMDYTNFIKSYLKFFEEDQWDKCIYHLMYEHEYWSHRKCIEFAEKLRRERLSPETPKGEAIV